VPSPPATPAPPAIGTEPQVFGEAPPTAFQLLPPLLATGSHPLPLPVERRLSVSAPAPLTWARYRSALLSVSPPSSELVVVKKTLEPSSVMQA